MSSKTLETRTFLKRNYGFVDNPAAVAKTVEISSTSRQVNVKHQQFLN